MDKTISLLFLFVCFLGLAHAGFHHCKITYPDYWDIAIKEDALIEGCNEFVYLGYDEDLNCSLYSHYRDPRVILLYDSHGHLAGVRVCYVKENIDQQAKWNKKEFTYYYDKIPSFTSKCYWGVDAWCKDLLFQSPEVLKSGGRKCSDWTNIWVKLNEDKYEEIPSDECLVEAMGFTKQSCYYGMGQHYFWEMTPWMDCSTYNGMVLMFNRGWLCGIAFAISGWHGNYQPKNAPIWFENATRDVVEDIVITYPDCWLENSYNFGLQDIHIMFVEDPLNVQCIWPWKIEDQCTYRSDHVPKYNLSEYY